MPQLDSDLQALVKRAQNMPVTSSRRSDQNAHRKATAFEALIGYWYITEPQGLAERKTQVLKILEDILRQNGEPPLGHSFSP